MANQESLREIAHTRAPFSTWLGVALLFALFGVIVLAIIGPSPRGDDYEQKRAKAREEKLKTLHEEETKALGTYGWIDKNKAVARLPIDRAMQLAVAELASKKPTAAGPIATPAPQASPAPAPASPTPAPAASPTPTGTPKATSVEGSTTTAGQIASHFAVVKSSQNSMKIQRNVDPMDCRRARAFWSAAMPCRFSSPRPLSSQSGTPPHSKMMSIL